MKRYLCLYFILISLITACESTSTKAALQAEVTLPHSTTTPTATATQRPTSTATPTRTPRPTATATATPSPTSTPIVLPTKQILMQFGIFGGDGGSPTDYYFGRGTPMWVLYTDGQLLFQKSDKNGDWFADTTLTVPQMCALLSRVERTGFFKIQGDGSLSTGDPIYKFDNTAQFSDGRPEYIIQVNGLQHKHISVYWDYVPYLIPEAKAAFDLFSKYAVPAKLIPYRAQYLLLWIEKGQGELAYATPAPPQAWPVDMPSLESLSKNNIETSAYVDESYGLAVAQALIKGEYVQPILRLFNNHLAGKLFTTGNGGYYVIARPLLPHEMPNTLSAYPDRDVEFELPFKCGK